MLFPSAVELVKYGDNNLSINMMNSRCIAVEEEATPEPSKESIDKPDKSKGDVNNLGESAKNKRGANKPVKTRKVLTNPTKCQKRRRC